MDYSHFLYMREELSLLAVILIVFIADLFLCAEKNNKHGVLNGMIPIILLSIHTLLNFIPGKESISAFGGMYQYDPMMSVIKSVLNVGTIVIFLMANTRLREKDSIIKQGEFHVLTLFTLLGMYFMISAGHFLMFFIGLELASIPMAALVAFDKYKHHSAEAGAKYILLAMFSGGLLLYGLSLIYGTSGTLYFEDVCSNLGNGWVQIAGLVFFFAGMGFKLSLVPFHLWTADVYQGAPTPVTGYLSVVSKGAAAFALLTIFIKVFAPLIAYWQEILFWVIIVSITLANLFAIRQKNIKRFMAFSSISQAGYLMLGVVGGNAQGMSALVYYILVYLVANLAIFTIIALVEQHSNKTEIEDYNGFYITNPKLSVLMTFSLFSLAGIPPFAGFFSKFFIFLSAFHAGFQVVVFIALLNTVISLYYYLLIVKAMFINKSEHPVATFKSDCYSRTALALCTAGVLLLGIAGFVFENIGQYAFGI